MLRWAAVPSLVPALAGTTADALFFAALVLAALLAALGIAVHLTERAPRTRQAAALAPGAVAVSRPARHRHLNTQELTRLSAFRARARLMAGEPLRAPGWVGTVRYAWQQGYSGWIVACLAGSFSMATHFGVWWFAAGGAWLGAILVTLLCTVVMVAACAWIGLGLVAGR